MRILRAGVLTDVSAEQKLNLWELMGFWGWVQGIVNFRVSLYQCGPKGPAAIDMLWLARVIWTISLKQSRSKLLRLCTFIHTLDKVSHAHLTTKVIPNAFVLTWGLQQWPLWQSVEKKYQMRQQSAISICIYIYFLNMPSAWLLLSTQQHDTTYINISYHLKIFKEHQRLKASVSSVRCFIEAAPLDKPSSMRPGESSDPSAWATHCWIAYESQN